MNQQQTEMNLMHPNWKALSSVHIDLKRFVREGEGGSSQESARQSAKKYDLPNISGTEIKEFYQSLTSETSASTSDKSPPKYAEQSVPVPPRIEKKIPFDRNLFFRAATDNNVDLLQNFDYKDDEINSVDDYGWTALMMAVCEGARDAVTFLLESGCDLRKSDGKGNDARSLAAKKKFYDILSLLNASGIKESADESSEEDEKSFKKFHCEICRREFKETSYRAHSTSTLHQFNARKGNHKSRKYFSIPPSNRGLKLMVKQGWDQESGLGPTNSGLLFPVKTVLRKPRTGLGVKQDSAKVTHFEPFDRRAVKYNAPPKTKNIKDIKRDQRRERRQEQRLRKELA